MKRFYIFLPDVIVFLVLSLEINNAQTPNYLWAKRAGQGFSEFGNSIARDASGNTYVTGDFISNPLLFDTVVALHDNSMDYNYFLVKYDSSGNVLWAKTSTLTNQGSEGLDVTVDQSGNVYVTGTFLSSIIQFDTTILFNKRAGTYDIFVVKYNSNGNVIWAKSAGGKHTDFAYGITVDRSGNCYVTGSFFSTIIFFDTVLIPNTNPNITTEDFYLVKYDSLGNVRWAKSTIGNGNEQGRSVSVDTLGHCNVTGYFTSSVTSFDTIQVFNSNIAGGSSDIFYAQYDTAGKTLWAKAVGGLANDIGYRIVSNNAGFSYITGYFRSESILFDTIPLFNASAGAGPSDYYVCKFDRNGNVVWSVSGGGEGDEEGLGISLDRKNNCYLSGYFTSDNFLVGSFPLMTQGSADIMIIKYSSRGTPMWVKSNGGNSFDFSKDIVADNEGRTTLTGGFDSNPIPFDTLLLVCNGSDDFFIVRLEKDMLSKEILFSVTSKWNLVSVPLTVNNNSVSTLFPGAISQAFAFQGMYVASDSLLNGVGYWLKFASPMDVEMFGYGDGTDSFAVREGWNLIGSVSDVIDVTTILSDPPELITSQLFGYSAGYYNVDYIEPGHGYWVKVNQDGYLILTSEQTNASNKIKIVASNELPPQPPEPEKVEVIHQAPIQFLLEQNYPNPCNPSTMINYQLPVDSFVSLRIFNTMGQEIQSLVSSVQEAGYYSVSWNASLHPSGIYFYRLDATPIISEIQNNIYSQVEKLLLLK